jgi:YVTN family beta-propeller protein/VCBS repeat-containing protein
LRRQIVHTLFNHTPTATPTVVDETDDGVITGSMGAVDPDGDPLRYKVTATPLHGTVVVANDGTYTYTESTDPTHRGLPDSFTVTVDDSAGIELPGLLGVVQSILHTGAQLLGFAQPDSRDVTILVNPLVGADRGIPVGNEPVAAVSKPGTTTVYVVNRGDNTVSVVDTASGAISKTIPVGHGPTAAAINPQGTAVYVLNQSDNTVSVIDTATNSVTTTVPGVANAGALVASTTNVYITRVGTNSVYNIDAGTKSVSTLDVGSNPLALAISPDGKTLYVARGNGITGYSVAAIDTGTKAITKTVNVGVTPIGVALTADGKNLYVVSNSTAAGVPLIDTATMAVTKTITVMSLGGTPQSIAVSPQGAVVMAMRGGSGWLEVLNSAAGVFQPAFGNLSSDQAGLVFVNGGHLLLVDRPGNRLVRVTA